MSAVEIRQDDDLKNLLLEIRSKISDLSLLLPSQISLSQLSAITGKSRQTLTAYARSNFEPQVEFWLENGKIILSQTAALKILRRYR